MKTLLLTLTVAFLTSVGYSQDAKNTTSKFDFVPGEKILFYDDFTSENLGDFPSAWLTNGSGEIVTASLFPGKWLQLTKTGYFIPEVKGKFTDNYTLEFDLVILGEGSAETTTGLDLFILSGNLASPAGGSQPGIAGLRIRPDYEQLAWNNWSEAREWQGDEGQVDYRFKTSTIYHMALWVQKQRVRLYANNQKILDLPRGLQANYTYNEFRIEKYSDEITPLLSNFRMAAGLPDMRNKLMTEGKLVTYGIYFDVNKDVVKPESYGTLREIAAILNEAPNVKVTIVGHTDSDGADAANLDLSKRRAASVKAELVKSFGVKGDRLITDGMGESQPVAGNDSPSNKALNRRVEFIKL